LSSLLRSAGPLRRRAPAATRLVAIGALVSGITSCSVDVLPEKPAVANTCSATSECGSNGVCTDGACYSRSGNIDEVLLEVVPEASSPMAGVSLFSMQDNLRRGAPSRAITLSGPVMFASQVLVNGEDLRDDCPYLKTGKQSIAARIRFERVGAVAGVPVADLSSGSTVTITTEPSTSATGFGKSVSLLPGYYDIYAQPIVSGNCQIPSKIWRGVEVSRDGQAGWAPPVTLELPTPQKFKGSVTRGEESLADWQLDIIDPQDEKVISTSARLGATGRTSPFTNFEVMYQPSDYLTPRATGPGLLPGTTEPLIRLRPPKPADATAPIVYWDLSGAGNGEANIDLSDLPTSAQLVTVAGQVGDSNVGIKATVKFFNSSFRLMLGLPTSYNPAVTTDAAGRYTIKLFPGVYRIVVAPEGAMGDGSGANAARPWALTVRQQIIGTDAMQTVDLIVAPTRRVDGVATAGAGRIPAQGATLEAIPLIASSSSVLTNLIEPPISPARASVPVGDDGKFALLLDPGYYDFALRPASASKFAWWILPSIPVHSAEIPGQLQTMSPHLFYPVPFGGTISVTMPDKPAQPLRNATVNAYARTPDGENVTQVGTARTDDMGRYQLALPPGFGSLP